jgi:hypothetical protein
MKDIYTLVSVVRVVVDTVHGIIVIDVVRNSFILLLLLLLP